MQEKKESISLQGEVEVPCDKSITHRSILFPSIASGTSRVSISSIGRDNLATLRVMRQLGVDISGSVSERMHELFRSEGVLDGFELTSDNHSTLVIEGKGIAGLKKPSAELDCGNSGTTSRLLCGILVACDFESTLTGDVSLKSRPFKRIADPLTKMGGVFSSDMLPMTVSGGYLHGIDHRSEKASAQVKSAILLAGLNASGKVSIDEPSQSRNHTELMFTAMGCPLKEEKTSDGRWSVSMAESGPITLSAIDTTVPGDFSSAAFFMVAASVIPGSSIVIKNICCNPSRTGLLDILRRMGANIELVGKRKSGGEDVADFVVKHAELKGIEVGAEEVVRAIDEIPILAIAAAFADGLTHITGAEELRVKESDRIAMSAEVLSDAGISCVELEDGMKITGQPSCDSTAFSSVSANSKWRSCHDHRIAMSAAVLELAVSGSFKASQLEIIETSFPGFSDTLQSLIE